MMVNTILLFIQVIKKLICAHSNHLELLKYDIGIEHAIEKEIIKLILLIY